MARQSVGMATGVEVGVEEELGRGDAVADDVGEGVSAGEVEGVGSGAHPASAARPTTVDTSRVTRCRAVMSSP
jgi:hypothetical protein